MTSWLSVSSVSTLLACWLSWVDCHSDCLPVAVDGFGEKCVQICFLETLVRDMFCTPFMHSFWPIAVVVGSNSGRSCVRSVGRCQTALCQPERFVYTKRLGIRQIARSCSSANNIVVFLQFSLCHGVCVLLLFFSPPQPKTTLTDNLHFGRTSMLPSTKTCSYER